MLIDYNKLHFIDELYDILQTRSLQYQANSFKKYKKCKYSLSESNLLIMILKQEDDYRNEYYGQNISQNMYKNLKDK